MRVIHVITRLIVGGAQENTIASVLGLQLKPQLEASLVTGPAVGPEGSLEHAFANCPALLTVLPALVRPLHPWKDCLAWSQLTALFRARHPDIVHTHSGKAGILGRLAAAQARVPAIVHTIHGPSFGAFQGAVANAVFGAAERYAARVTTHFVSVAEAMTQQYLAAGIGRRDRYTTILSGFDLTPFLVATNDLQFRSKLGLTAEDIVIGKIARLFKLKGHDDLLSVAPQIAEGCPRVKFLFVGDGLWRSRLESKVWALGLQGNVVFTGLVAPAEIPQLIGVMDLLVHLSTREGLPRALPQALAGARPVVAYDRYGAREVCLDNETGFLVPPGNLNTLKARLLQLAQDPALRQRLGQQGQRFVRERFGVQRMVDELYRLYLRLRGGRA